ncbi:hypothetical protein [Litoribaculum gwangyangense]|uniref:Uncharacterized protein n=1 Tax=Litoribaculum gwangyangense TaxID=1130722 RepID=A0ABP9BXM3_9FLAO
MQIVKIDLHDGYPLYCPATGHQILSEEEFIPSPAMQFCFVQDEGVFEVISDDARLLFGLNDDEIDMDYEVYEKKLHELVERNEDIGWVIFRVCSGGTLNSFVVDHCINMWFNKTNLK